MPQPPQNLVVLEIAAPQTPQNRAGGAAEAAGVGEGAGARVATTGEPQIPQTFSDPVSGLLQEAQT
ncbi:MAG TPA: hypothetical protein VLL74_05875 [Methanoregula sp.]|nr:hypothetical protein [Methanoregula sp.]